MIYIILFVGILLILWLIIQNLSFGKENKFLKDLAKEIGCSYKKSILGSGKIKGNYKGEMIEIGIYEGLAEFIGWSRKTLSLLSAGFIERMRGKRIIGMKVFIKKTIEEAEKVQLGMVVAGNLIFYIVKGKYRFGFGPENKAEVKEALEKAIEVAKQIEIKGHTNS